MDRGIMALPPGPAADARSQRSTRYDAAPPFVPPDPHEGIHSRHACGGMSPASRLADASEQPRIERLQPWIAALSSVLLHLLCLLLAMLSPPITVEMPQGGDAGATVLADFIGLSPPQPTPAELAVPPPAAAPPPSGARIRTTPVPRADDPVAALADAPAPAASPQRQPRAAPPQARPAPPAPTAAPPASRRPGHVHGQPPGMLRQATAPVNAGTGRSPALERGRGRDASDGASLSVGGYQVYYDLSSETRLRAWRDQGMTELFIPLPGTRDLMVCPLETALRRESGECRLLPPDAPELADIGDARQVIAMHQVYRRGELVWSGPRAYR
jgi:hypothetical protein